MRTFILVFVEVRANESHTNRLPHFKFAFCQRVPRILLFALVVHYISPFAVKKMKICNTHTTHEPKKISEKLKKDPKATGDKTTS